jgi:hypothetical protein
MKNLYKILLVITLSIYTLFKPIYSVAETTLVGLATDGSVYDVNKKTGALTLKANEAFTSFSLGAIARNKNDIYYVAAPSGSTENSLFTANIKSGVISHVDLDRSDEVRALFFNGGKLYGIFYNGSAGTAGVYQIKIKTGVTKLVLDLSSLSAEPVGGAFARHGAFFYTILKPNNNQEARQLLQFKTKSGSAKVNNITTKDGSNVKCDRLKRNKTKQNFVCLASTSSSQVDIYTLGLKGKATFQNTLSNVERIAGGHTMMSPDEKTFYAFVYAPGDSNSQRLIKFTAKGVVKSTSTVSSIIIGARFGKEEETP